MADGRARLSRYQRTAEAYRAQLGASPKTPAPIATPPAAFQPQPITATPPHPSAPTVPVAPAAPRPAPTPTSTVAPAPAPSKGAGGPRRPDPRKLPNPTKVPVEYKKVVFTTYPHDGTTAPPPPHSKYVVDDRGSSSPRFMRSTIYQVAASKDILDTSHIPFAVAIQPLADIGYDEYEVPVVDLSPNGPLRCRRCAAYINPLVKFVDGGHSYLCSLCGTSNEVPSHYFSPLEPNGQRRDLAERAELWRGSVDFVAPPELSTKPISPPTFLFIIDVSARALQAGLLQAFTNSIRQILEQSFAEDQRTMVGFITVDSSVHFWKLVPSLQMIVLPDIDNVFQPLPHSAYLANYSTHKEQIEAWLTQAPKLLSQNNSPQSALGAAVHAASLSLGNGGGRIIVLQAALPNVGPGKCQLLDETRGNDTTFEALANSPQAKFYNDVAIECTKRSVVVDLFFCSSEYVSIATIGQLSKLTGGQVYYLPNFTLATHEEKLFFDLRRNMTRTQGSGAVLRVRCSEGLTVDSYHGHFMLGPTGQDIELAGIDADKTILVHIKYDDVVPQNRDAVIQAAMLYANQQTGQRLIRVHTLALKPTTALTSVFKSADVDTVLYTLARRAIAQLPKMRVSEIRTKLTQMCIEMLTSYRRYCARNSSESQLILPDSLKLLPVYLCGLLKNVFLNNLPTSRPEGWPSNTDGRAYMAYLLSTISLEALAPHVYPRLYYLNSLLESEEEEESEEDSDSDDEANGKKKEVNLSGEQDLYGSYWLPPITRLSSSELQPQGVYLLDDGQSLFLAVNPPANAQVMSRLFDERGALLYNPEDDFNRRVHNIIMAIRHRRPYYQPLLIFNTQQNHVVKRQFFERLLEDGNDDYTNKDLVAVLVNLSYSGYLCHIHRSIQDKM